MIVLFLLTFGCEEEKPTNTSFSSFVEEDTGSVQPQPEPSEPDPIDPVEEPKTGTTLRIISETISCEELQKYV